jgi:hypothetical protein
MIYDVAISSLRLLMISNLQQFEFFISLKHVARSSSLRRMRPNDWSLSERLYPNLADKQIFAPLCALRLLQNDGTRLIIGCNLELVLLLIAG